MTGDRARSFDRWLTSRRQCKAVWRNAASSKFAPRGGGESQPYNIGNGGISSSWGVVTSLVLCTGVASQWLSSETLHVLNSDQRQGIQHQSVIAKEKPAPTTRSWGGLPSPPSDRHLPVGGVDQRGDDGFGVVACGGEVVFGDGGSGSGLRES